MEKKIQMLIQGRQMYIFRSQVSLPSTLLPPLSLKHWCHTHLCHICTDVTQLVQHPNISLTLQTIHLQCKWCKFTKIHFCLIVFQPLIKVSLGKAENCAFSNFKMWKLSILWPIHATRVCSSNTGASIRTMQRLQKSAAIFMVNSHSGFKYFLRFISHLWLLHSSCVSWSCSLYSYF